MHVPVNSGPSSSRSLSDSYRLSACRTHADAIASWRPSSSLGFCASGCSDHFPVLRARVLSTVTTPSGGAEHMCTTCFDVLALHISGVATVIAHPAGASRFFFSTWAAHRTARVADLLCQLCGSIATTFEGTSSPCQSPHASPPNCAV